MAYESKFKNDDIDELFRAVLLLEDEEDCYRFFEDICTINEIHAIAQRLQVAKLLSENRTYNEIESITKASTANAWSMARRDTSVSLRDSKNKTRNDSI